MDTQRETREFTTPSGLVVKVKTYLTARERNALALVVPAEGLPEDLKTLDAATSVKLGESILRAIIFSVNGVEGEGAVDVLLDAKTEDYDHAIEESAKAISGNLTSAK